MPGMPQIAGLPRRSSQPRHQPEYRLQCLIADVLRLQGRDGLYWTAIPNGEYRSPITGARLKRSGVRAGAPDFLLIWNSKAIGLELKTERGRQSPEQRDTERDWTMAGGVYFVARGYRAAIEFLLMLDCIRPIREGSRFAPRQPAEAA